MVAGDVMPPDTVPIHVVEKTQTKLVALCVVRLWESKPGHEREKQESVIVLVLTIFKQYEDRYSVKPRLFHPCIFTVASTVRYLPVWDQLRCGVEMPLFHDHIDPLRLAPVQMYFRGSEKYFFHFLILITS